MLIPDRIHMRVIPSGDGNALRVILKGDDARPGYWDADHPRREQQTTFTADG